MLLKEVLDGYPDDELDRLAADKVDEVSSLRLPRQVIIQEIASALSSLSYVAGALAPARPPAVAFLKLIMEAPEHRVPVEGFRYLVQERTDLLTKRAEERKGLSASKQYDLYLAVLHAAWEDGGHVDRSEALLLQALRRELGIWTREHLLLEHHPNVRPIWDGDNAFAETRNYLLGKGLVLLHEDQFVLADEVWRQIRSAWDADLADVDYRRLLNHLSGTQLRNALEAADLPLSGSKDDRVERLVQGLIPPAEVLDALHIHDVKDLCRVCRAPARGHKADLVNGLIDHFDHQRDLEEVVEDGDDEPDLPPEPEPRAIPPEQLDGLLQQLTGDLLYDILDRRDLKRSGSKAKRIRRLLESPWSERTLLGDLRNSDLAALCRKLDIPVSGVKAERIDRLLEWAADPLRDSERDAQVGERGPGIELPPDEPREPAAATSEGSDAGDEREAAPKPPGLSEIRTSYPDLRPDQAVILAVLQDARSLNEQELSRAAHRHRLGWTLTKAHMADLLATLKRSGQAPFRLRGTGRANVYEWIGTEAVQTGTMDRVAARDVIDALRQGVVPKRHLDLLAVGQDEIRAYLPKLLDEIAQGDGEFRFLRGPYGAGKTFLCSWLRDQALESDFAVSTVRIGPDQPLSDLPVFFSGLMDGLRVPQKPGASALAEILECWLLHFERKAIRSHESDARQHVLDSRWKKQILESLEQELGRLASLDPGFAPAVKAYYRARLDGDHETAWAALAWLRGDQALSLKARRSLNVSGHLTPAAVFPRMRALLEVVAGGYLKGLVVFIDELELVRRFPHARQREQAYETLRQMIDECGENRLPRCLLICTGTDQLFEDERYGIPSYQALAHRVGVMRVGDGGGTSLRQPIIQLAPLDGNRLLLVAKKVREVHATAYEWAAAQRVPDEILQQVVDRWTAFGEGYVDRLPRPFLRHIVNLLDVCEERPELAPEELLRDPVSERDVAESVLGALQE